jgi:hypothetical protein
MPKRSSLKRKIKRNFGVFNCSAAIFSILAGYAVVMFLNSSGNDTSYNTPSLGTIAQATIRLADSFELYNQKKFSSSDLAPSR